MNVFAISSNLITLKMITDGHPAHKTKMLNEWLAGNKDRIKVFFMPPYSPELILQEYVKPGGEDKYYWKETALLIKLKCGLM